MDKFGLYIRLGFDHITDLAGFDHILFLIALCAVYTLSQWRQLLVLVTAFTVGHSITLALAATDTLKIPSDIIEFLIPTTILMTALHNVLSRGATQMDPKMGIRYAMALLFGFIHGMGFSNFFRALMMGENAIALPLLGFNLGIEIGQLIVVALIFVIGFVFLNILRLKHREWTVFISGAAAGVAGLLMSETKFW